MRFRLNKYLTFYGKIQEVVIPDSTYGEWIVYENNKPKFHVNIFDYEHKSNCLLRIILNETDSSFNKFLNDLNQRLNKNLTLSIKPSLGFKINSKLIEFSLDTLPFKWIEHYTELIRGPWEKYPDKDPNDMFWRMGKGEDALSTFASYYNSLDVTEKEEFEKVHKPTSRWSDFYRVK